MWCRGRNPRLFVAAAVILLLGAMGNARAQDAAKFRLKPGAAGKLCLACHTDFQDVLRLPVVHTPVKSGACASCHDPHAARHGKLLETTPDAICASCHGTMIPDGAKSTHDAVVKGGCVSCHDPHASANPGMLRRAGNALCLDCHKDVQAAQAAASHHHAPVDANCLGCHDPHASKNAASLLKKPVPELCVACHKTEQPAFAKAHAGYAVAKSDCASCHDPHGSSQPGILWANVHAPMQKKMCGQCHGSPAEAASAGFTADGPNLCRGCHNPVFVDIQSKNHVHEPVVEGVGCAHCHTPHASKTGGLLAAPQKQLCGRCHADSIARQERSVTKHPPIQDGDCSTCHQPHAADATFLFPPGGSREVCGACHDWSGHSAHPIGDNAVDQRNPNLRLDCDSCHRTHGSPFKFLAHGDVKGELCTQCHTKFTR